MRLLSLALALFLLALLVVSLGASRETTWLVWVGLLLFLASGGLTLFVRFFHGDTCEVRQETGE